MSIASHNATPARPNARAMVALIAGPEPSAVAPEDLTRWRQLTPAAMWAFVSLTKVNRTTLVDDIAALMKRRAITPRQLILLGCGDTGRRAFELVAQGALGCAGIVAVDIPCHPLSFAIVPAVSAIRLVIHHDGSRPAGERLVDELQRADIDVRVIGLCAAANRAAAIASAAETFVLELVAMIGRYSGPGV
ncbi:MAG TPA: hypothetical protein VF901_22865 [Bradyrhizobium sp.]